MAKRNFHQQSAALLGAILLTSSLSFGHVSKSCTAVFTSVPLTTTELDWAHYYSVQKGSPYSTGVWSQGAYGKDLFNSRRWLYASQRIPVLQSDPLRIEAEAAVDQVFRVYARRQIVQQESIAEMRRLDGQLKMENLNYIFFSNPKPIKLKLRFVFLMDLLEI